MSLFGIRQISDGAGTGIALAVTEGGNFKSVCINTSSTGTVATTGIQLNAATPPTGSQSTSINYPSVLCRVWSTAATAPATTIHFYDAATAAGCTLANQVWEGTVAGATGQAPLQLNIPCTAGLFYALGASVAANAGIGISWN